MVKFTKNGFTLVEFMIVIAILSIIALFAVPNFSNWVLSSRIKGTTSNLQSAINLARSETMRLNGADIFEVLPTTGTNFAGGWCVQARPNPTNMSVVNCNNTAIKVFPAPHSSVVVQAPNLRRIASARNGLIQVFTGNPPTQVALPFNVTIASSAAGNPSTDPKRRDMTINLFDINVLSH